MCRQELERGAKWQAIEPAESAWCLQDGEKDERGEPAKSLMITLARPPVTESEIQYKKGQRPCSDRELPTVFSVTLAIGQAVQLSSRLPCCRPSSSAGSSISHMSAWFGS